MPQNLKSKVRYYLEAQESMDHGGPVCGTLKAPKSLPSLVRIVDSKTLSLGSGISKRTYLIV